MGDSRAPLGLLLAAVGAAVLALSVFAPWYGVSVTASGAAATQHELATVAAQYGNPTFRSRTSGLGTAFRSLAGRQIATVTARQAVKRDSTIVLVLAGIAFIASLLRLADLRRLLFASGSQIALAGALAGAVVFFRTLWRPGTGVSLISVSLSWGIWLAFASAVAIVGAGLAVGSDRASTRLRTKIGPGPPPLMSPPSNRR